MPEIPCSFRETTLGELFKQTHEPGTSGLPVVSVTMGRGLVPRDEMDRRVETKLTAGQHRLARTGDIAYNMMRM